MSCGDEREEERVHGSGTSRTRPKSRKCGGRGAVSSGGAGKSRKWKAADGKREENGAVIARVWRIRSGVMAEGKGAAIV